MAAQDSGTHTEHVNAAGPGGRLRARRESLGWSVEQVAGKLHLDARYIRALEQDRHAEIAAPVFVRGYLRSYALLLQLPADAIVECYTVPDADKQAVFAGPVQFQGLASTPPSVSRWLIVLAIVAGVAGVIAYLWYVPPASVASLPAQVDIPSPAPPPAYIAPGEEPVGVVPEPEIVVTPPMISAVEGQPLASPAGAEHRSVVATQIKVVLRFVADSWVMISDATGRTIMYELVPGGSSRVLEGATPPLQVVLGNSPAVTVEYNGALFDQSRYSYRRVARFTLAEADTP